MHSIRAAGRSVKQRVDAWRHHRKATGLGAVFVSPNYLFLPRFEPGGSVIDVGCGSEAEFSNHLIGTYGVKAYAVDPTRKHRDALRGLEDRWDGRFVHIPVAVGARPGTVTFHESAEHESGSLLADHDNVERDSLRSYDVEVRTLAGLIETTGVDVVDLVKLDLEGAEYDLIASIERSDLERIRQLFIEFHHHCVRQYGKDDTLASVQALEQLGMTAITVDDHNYLFHWPA